MATPDDQDPSVISGETTEQSAAAPIDVKTKPATDTPTAPEVAGGDTASETETVEGPAETDSADNADTDTDKAVEAIVKKEGDDVLKAEDEAAETAVVIKAGHWQKFKNMIAGWWADPRKRYGTLGGILLIIVILFVVPLTRYDILGLVLRQQVTVTAVDSKSGAPISGAMLSMGGQQVKTEANGKAVFRPHLGSKQLAVNKKYYRGYAHKELVTFSATHNHFKASLLALGQQVQVKVINKVSGKPVSGATINVHGAQTKTDANGMVAVQIPSGATTQAATVGLKGYNIQPVTVTAGSNVSKNTFSITPAGKLYFLSNLSGKIDVVKTNLDGTDRQTVLAGTGNEDPNSTSLLASRDWKYLALLSKRSGTNASVYLIDTTNGDKLTTIDEGNANFNLVGWSGDNFIYQTTRNTVSDWQPNQEALKSLDATTGQTLLLAQTQGSGTSESDYVKQSFGSPYIIGDQVVYTTNWESSYNTNDISQVDGKSAELDTIGADGSGHKVVKSFTVDPSTQAQDVFINTELYEPDGLYVYFVNGSDGNQFYDYDDGKITGDTTMTDTTYYNTPYPTYLLSPSGDGTFWSEQRDGKNTLFVGDEDGKSPKQIATLSDYNTYGWYGDNYLLVSKSSSELYIMPAAGGTPLKISDYYKPAINYNGYGGGYGGL